MAEIGSALAPTSSKWFNRLMGRVSLILVVLLLCWPLRSFSSFLRGRPAHPMGVALPGAATLGFYALTGCTFLGMLIFHASRHRSLAGIVSRHALLLLMASLFCFDYMFNNFGGTTSLKDGSYGLVACLDLIIFVFVWALGLKYLPGTGSDYTESFMALLVPVFPVLREMVRAEKPIHIGPATVDLVVVIFLMASWITLPYGSSEPAQYGRVAKLCKYVVCAALLYNLIGCLKTSHLSCWD